MRRLTSIIILVLTLGVAYLAGGCAVYDVAVEERNVGTWASDEKTALLIKEKFLSDDIVKFMDFDADCYQGHAYVFGEYESREQVNRAVQLAKSVEGVNAVTTYLLPKRKQDYCGTTDNMDIHTRLKHALVSDKNIWSTNINIETIQCNVLLLGIVGSEQERDAVIAHAKQIVGVRSVKSYIQVN